MQNARLGMLASLCSLVAALAFSCGTDEGTSPSATGDGGSDAGSPRAGESQGGNATASGGTSSGGMPPNAGEGGTLAHGGTAGAASEGGVGGAPLIPTEGEQLVLCNRLIGLIPHATAVSRAFSKAIYADCRVKWVVPLVEADLIEYKNRLITWSLELWGCQGDPVTELALAFHQPDLSRGDATILIERYLDIVEAEVDLSPPERVEMQAALERLAAPLVVDESSEPSQSKCVVNPGVGGAGGAGGESSAPLGGAPGAAGEASAAGFGGAL